MPRLIPLLTEMSLQEVLDKPFVQEQLGPLLERHWAGLELIRSRAELRDGVITFDITDQPTEGLQQVHPVLPAAGGDVYGGAEPVELSDEDRGWYESVDKAFAGGEAGEPGGDL